MVHHYSPQAPSAKLAGKNLCSPFKRDQILITQLLKKGKGNKNEPKHIYSKFGISS